MRRRITEFMGAAVLTAMLAGPATAAEPTRQAKPVQFPSSYLYTARVQTSNITGAGSNAMVWMYLYGTDNNSPVLPLSNAHGPGQVRYYTRFVPGYLGRITRICVQRNDAGISPSWHLQSIRVNATRVAYFNRTIPANVWVCQSTV